MYMRIKGVKINKFGFFVLDYFMDVSSNFLKSQLVAWQPHLTMTTRLQVVTAPGQIKEARCTDYTNKI